MEKAFSNFTWENYPSLATPLSQQNLNKINTAVNEIDNRVIIINNALPVEVIRNNVTLSTSQSTTVEITDEVITTNSSIFVWTSANIDYDSMLIETGKCTLVFDKQDTALTINIKLDVK